jgi:hypothetical protein
MHRPAQRLVLLLAPEAALEMSSDLGSVPGGELSVQVIRE